MIFAEQARALAEAGVDLLYIETMADLNEARAAVEGARQADDRIPITVTLSFDKHGRTNMGVRPEQAAEALLKMGVAAVGANCGHSLEMTLEALEKMHAYAPQAALIAKPNAGLPRMVERREVYDATPEVMADYALKYIAAGARIVGGCCGSTPEHIRAIARAVK
jgi:5-methyltetrahydrofolate--homocysteine methyltransferase